MIVSKRLNNEYREITAPILVPDETDWQGHIYDEEEVLKACRNYRDNCDRENIQHKFDLVKDNAEFVEHYITPAEMTFGEGEDSLLVKKGTWMGTMRIKNDTLWNQVKEGKFTGFSIQASCKSIPVAKSKVAGRIDEEEGIETTKRLFDIDFSKDIHHVALVDEAANNTEVLVLKSKNKQKEDKMSDDTQAVDKAKAEVKAELELNELIKNKEAQEELIKEKDAKTADLEAQLAELTKSKEAQEEDLKKFKEEKEAKEMEELVAKAKELKADDADSFGVILSKCKKALEETEYEALETQLSKLANIEDNKELFVNKGKADAVTKSLDDEFYAKREKYQADGLDKAQASRKARLELENK